MDASNAQEMAMFRFGVIAPVINGTFGEASKLAYYRKVCADALTLPDGTKAAYSPSTLSYWEHRYRKGGYDALVAKSRSDKGNPRRLSPEAIDAICELRRQFPRINATMLRERLIEEGVITAGEASLSTVQRFVRGLRADAGGPGGAQAKDRRAFEAERALELWQADTLFGPYVGEGGRRQRAYLVMIVDDKTRLIAGGRFFAADNAYNFQTVFKEAVLRFGIPERLYVDNGAPYRNDQLSAICGALGTVLIHAPARDGAAKGKVERANRTVRGRFLSVLEDRDKGSLDSLNAAFASWAAGYNAREHSAHGRTPMDAYRAEAGSVRAPRSPEWVDECFLNRVTRKVRNDATVSIDRVSYDAPMGLIGQKVEIRFLPGDMGAARVAFEGRDWPLRPTDKVANSKARRAPGGYQIDYSAQGGDGDDGLLPPALPAQP